MNGYVENGFRAIVRPKQVIEIGGFMLIPEMEYLITKQEEPEGNPEGLKRTFIQGSGGVALWYGYPIEENFEVVKVLNQKKTQ